MSAIFKKLRSGIFYTALATYGRVLLSLIIGAVLARLLSPKEFGIVSLVTVFTTFFNLLSSLGIGPAVVQNQTLSKREIESIFLFSILVGAVLSGVLFFVSPLVAVFYGDPRLIKITQWLSLGVWFYACQAVPMAINQKKLRFKQIGLAIFIVQMLTGTLAIILAYNGFSYYSLIIKSILDALFTFIALYCLQPIKFTLNIRKKSILKIAKFSSFQFMFDFINYFSRNADNLLIGKFFGAAAIGYYDKSYRLMTLPVQNLTHVVTPALMPVLSQYQDSPQKIYQSYLPVVMVLAFIGFPLSAFLYFSAPELIRVTFGFQWEQSIPVFRLLAVTVCIQMVLSSSGAIFQSVNRTDILFYSGSLSAVTTVGAISYGVFVGGNIESVAGALIVAFIINFLQAYYLLTRVVFKESFLAFLRLFIFPSCLAIVLVGLYSGLQYQVNLKSNLLSLMIKILIYLGVIGMAAITVPSYKKLLTRFMQSLKN